MKVALYIVLGAIALLGAAMLFLARRAAASEPEEAEAEESALTPEVTKIVEAAVAFHRIQPNLVVPDKLNLFLGLP